MKTLFKSAIFLAVMTAIAGCAFCAQDPDETIAESDKIIAAEPASPDAYYNRGLAHYKKGEFDKAIEDVNKVLEISPDAADALYVRGLSYFKKNNIKQAIADYERVIEMRPDFPLVYSARAIAYFQKKDYGRTLADVNKAVALGFRMRPLKKAPDEKIVEKIVVVEKAAAGDSPEEKAARKAKWMARRLAKNITIAVLALLLAGCLTAILILVKKKRSAGIFLLPLVASLLMPCAVDARVIEECVYLVPAGKVDRKVVEKVKSKLPGLFPMSIKAVIDEPREMPQAAYDAHRAQYSAQAVIDDISQKIVLALSNERAIIITDDDIYVPGAEFVLGAADAGKGIGIISLARLKNEFYAQKPDSNLLAERALKETANALGHCWKIADCPSAKCVMFLTAKTADIDRERQSFCYKCNIALENRNGTRGIIKK